MRISARVRANSREEKVEKISDGQFAVHVRAPAKEGMANEAVIKALGAYFNIPKSRIRIAKGLGSKNKIIDIF